MFWVAGGNFTELSGGSYTYINTRNDMEYEEFLRRIELLSTVTSMKLKHVYDECDQCFSFCTAFLEMLGDIKLMISSNKDRRDQDEEIKSFFLVEQVAIFKIALKAGLCSHLESSVDFENMEKGEDYKRAKKMIDDKKVDA